MAVGIMIKPVAMYLVGMFTESYFLLLIEDSSGIPELKRWVQCIENMQDDVIHHIINTVN